MLNANQQQENAASLLTTSCPLTDKHLQPCPILQDFPPLRREKKGNFFLVSKASAFTLCHESPSFLISPGMCQKCLFQNYSLTLDCWTEWSSDLLPQHKVFSKFGPAYFFSLILVHPRRSHRSDTLTSLQAPGRFRPASLHAFIHLTKIYWLLLTFRAMC